ncbi:unnamed protein product [Gordionus sp. m RMFG-2023]
MTNSIKSEDVTPSGVIFDSTAQTNDDYRGSRPAWNRQLDFIFSLIGYAVGVGNIWRFPNLCYRNGGGAFLIPYSLMLFACGIPLFFLEVSLGQFSNKGAIKVWDICPLFRGVGIGTLVITTICNVYYNLLIAFILFYLFSSFTSMLPWSQCNHKWNSPSCIVLKDQVHRNETMIGDLRSKSTSTFEFWHYKVLNISEGLHHMGSINWKLAGYFILAWTIAYLCLIKGIKSTGKIVYFTATFPYVMLTILLIRSLLLPGAFNGILYFIRPNWKLGYAPLNKIRQSRSSGVKYSSNTSNSSAFASAVSLSSSLTCSLTSGARSSTPALFRVSAPPSSHPPSFCSSFGQATSPQWIPDLPVTAVLFPACSFSHTDCSPLDTDRLNDTGWLNVLFSGNNSTYGVPPESVLFVRSCPFLHSNRVFGLVAQFLHFEIPENSTILQSYS